VRILLALAVYALLHPVWYAVPLTAFATWHAVQLALENLHDR
jgi:hypothetical protein